LSPEITIHTALRQATRLLEESGIAAPRLTAEVLLCHALRREKAYLYAHPEEPLSELTWIHFGRYLHERSQGKPTQYITKRQEFYGREFQVSPDVLIPRPETEHLVEAAIERLQDARRIVDVGTGSGAIAVTLALETPAEVWGTDISPRALAVARANARALAAGERVRLTACDLLSGLREGCFDAVVSNPPYVPITERESLQREIRDYEPAAALFGGDDGFVLYRGIIQDAQRVLKPGGWLILELGFKSEQGVRAMLGEQWEQVATVPDLAGIPRVLLARLAACKGRS
jgi:release factor glutamine methyltransferase